MLQVHWRIHEIRERARHKHFVVRSTTYANVPKSTKAKQTSSRTNAHESLAPTKQTDPKCIAQGAEKNTDIHLRMSVYFGAWRAASCRQLSAVFVSRARYAYVDSAHYRCCCRVGDVVFNHCPISKDQRVETNIVCCTIKECVARVCVCLYGMLPSFWCCSLNASQVFSNSEDDVADATTAADNAQWYSTANVLNIDFYGTEIKSFISYTRRKRRSDLHLKTNSKCLKLSTNK